MIQLQEMDSVSTKADKELNVSQTIIKQDYFLLAQKSDLKICEIINVLGTDEKQNRQTKTSCIWDESKALYRRVVNGGEFSG